MIDACARCKQERELPARGICRPCYDWLRLHGNIEDFPLAGRHPEPLPPYVTAWCGIGGANHASCGLSEWADECTCRCHQGAGSYPQREGVG